MATMRRPIPISISSVKPPRPRILAVEPDPVAASTLQHSLESEGFQVWVAEDGRRARAILREAVPNLVVLDVMLPDIDGLVLCADIKAEYDLPIIVTSATKRRRDAILALRLGADDFVAKPFEFEDLEARIGAVLRRAGATGGGGVPAEPDHYEVGELTVDRLHRRATLGGEEINLTPTEYRLLSALVSRPEEVFSREELTRLAWGWGDTSRSRTVDTHVRRLRVKLRSTHVPPPTIICVRGSGYKITAQPESNSGMSSVA
jgi:DNA-binding response OmpR family regulator